MPECRTGCENCFQIKICNTLRSLACARSLALPRSLSLCLLCLLPPPPASPVAVCANAPCKNAANSATLRSAQAVPADRSNDLQLALLSRSLSLSLFRLPPLLPAQTVGHLLSRARSEQFYCTRFYASIERRSLGESERQAGRERESGRRQL